MEGVIHTTVTEEGIKELGQVLNQLDRKFCVSGVLPVSAESPVKILFEQDSDKQKSSVDSHIRKIVFPLSDASQVDGLIEYCSPASFGFNTETVLDANYRKALKLDGSCLATNFDVYSTGVINKIKKALVLESKIKPSSDIHAELHKLNVYGPEGFFKAHVDTPISADMFGSLVVCLPVAFDGGILTVTRGESDSYSKSKNSDSSKSFDWGPSTKESDSNNHLIQWAAFFSDCPHEISPIVSGTRITLTYNLFKRSLAEEVLLNAEMSLPRDCAFLTQFQAQLSEQFFFESGAVLMFHCQHAYQVTQEPTSSEGRRTRSSNSAAIDSETVIPLLKGADMSVFEAAVACGLQVFVKPLYDGARYTDSYVLGTQFRQFHESSDHQYEEQFKFLKDAAGDIVEVDNKKVVWFGHPLKMNRHEYLHYGNEATVGYVYSSAVIMVVVPAWKDRKQQYDVAEIKSSPNYDAYISYADEFEAEWADPLQYYLGKHGILAHAHKKQNGISRNRQAEKLIQSTETKVPRSRLSRKRSEDEKGILTNARTNTYVVVISAPTLKLMALRLAEGLSDHLMEEWKEILRICQADVTRKLILLKLSGSFEFEAEGEIKELVDALTAVGQSQCISVNVGPPPTPVASWKRDAEPPQKIAVAVKQDVIPEIMGLQFGDIDGLIELTNRHFETLVSGKGKRTLVVKTYQELHEWFTGIIIPHLESKISAFATTSDIKPLPKELNAQYVESSYQYAFIMSHVSKQDDKFHKYLKIAADGDHSQKHSAQYFFAKEMEDVDPALSFDYYKLSCQQGNPLAIFRLAELWEIGSPIVGGQVSLENAIEYFQLAGNLGHQEGYTRALKWPAAEAD